MLVLACGDLVELTLYGALPGLQSALGDMVKQASSVHNLIEGTELASHGFIDSASNCRLGPRESGEMLRSLLQLYSNGAFDPTDVPRLSNLECGIINKTGNHVWASREEMEEYGEEITIRCVGPTTFQPQQALDAPSSGSFRCFLTVRRVTDLTPWNWRKTFVEWQLLDKGGRSAVADRTPRNPDDSDEPAWADDKHLLCVESLENLQTMRLQLTVKRPSRSPFSPMK